jgi:hypothetical protein
MLRPPPLLTAVENQIDPAPGKDFFRILLDGSQLYGAAFRRMWS